MNKALVIYMPALHAGYTELIRRQEVKEIFLIDEAIATDLIPRLERDIRALKAEEVAAMLSTCFKNLKVHILKDAADFTKLQRMNVIVPNEDVSIKIAKRYLKDQDIKFINAFLRWDMRAVNTSTKVSPNLSISNKDIDRKLMGQAKELSAQSPDWWRQVGAILVKDKELILSGYNRGYPNQNYNVEIFGDPRINFDAGEKTEFSKYIHAEAYVISKAAKKGISTQGASMYVSTFPCPVCAKLIANAGIKEVFFSEGYSVLDAEDILLSKKVTIFKVD
jgi:dCMP deaminase